MTSRPSTVHYRACNLCEAICGLEIGIDAGEIVSIRGDEDDPFSRGHICPKAVALQDIQNDPDRLRRPLRKTRGGSWESISWSSALNETADRLRSIQKEHGRDAVATYLGNPTVHNHGLMLFAPPLLRTLRSRNRFSATSVDQLSHHVAAWAMFGHQLFLPVPDIDRTDCLLVLGANPLVSNGSMMTAPGFRRRLRELRDRGGRLVVIDPRRTETALIADRHHFIRPGTDALLLLALLHTIFAEELDRPGRLASLTRSMTDLQNLVEEFPATRVSDATGIDAPEIRALARDFAASPAAVCYGRLGVSTQEFGGLCQWLVNALNIVTGNLDRAGGAMFPLPAIDVSRSMGRGHYARYRSRVRGLPEFGGELPVAALAEEILTAGDGQIHALLTVAGNPVLSTPNGVQLDRALSELDFMAAIDFYVNETTRHAQIILPPTAPLEHDHYDLVFNLLAVRNVARYSPPLFAPSADSRHDWQILSELDRRLGSRSLKARARRWITTRGGPRRLLDLGLRLGPYGGGARPFSGGLTLARLEGSFHGIDLGPLQAALPERLPREDKLIELAPEIFVADLGRLRRKLAADSEPSIAGEKGASATDPSPPETAPAETPSLLLIGRRHLQSNNSWMHNYSRLMGGRPRCTLLMHPDDANLRGLSADEEVAVVSRTGRVIVPLAIDNAMMPGVVSLPHGWGHDRSDTRITTAEQQPGVSLNDLTDADRVDELSGTAVLNGIRVQVEFPGA